MPSVEELLGGGELLGEGGFTIDPELARQKLRQFQLPDPRRYVLLLVQAAAHLGATFIDFEIDAGDVRARFDGDPLVGAELQVLHRFVFVPGTDPRGQARRELALALNAAMALHPRSVRLCAFPGSRGAFLELRPDAPDIVGTIDRPRSVAGPHPITIVHVRDRFRPGLLLEFVRDLHGDLAEERILREYCRWSPIPVRLDGESITTTLALGDACIVRVAIEHDDITGEVGFVDDEDLRPRAEVLGVLVTTLPLAGFPAGFRAVVDAPRLRKDLARHAVVRDAAHDQLVDVLEAAAAQALTALATHVAEHDPRDAPAWVVDVLRSALVRRGPIELLDLDAPLATAPLWPATDRWRSTVELHHASDDVEYYASDAERGLPAGYGDVILAADVGVRKPLLALFGPRAVDRTAAVADAVDRLARHDAFLGRAYPRTLGAGRWFARWWIKTDALTGELGLRHGGDAAAIRLLVEGRLLESRRFDARMLPLPALVAVVEGPFRPNTNWDAAERDDALASALAEIVNGVHGLVRQEAEAIGTADVDPELARALLPYFAAVARGTFERTLFAAMGYAGDDPRIPAARELDVGSVLGTLRLFATIDGRALGLRDIVDARGDGPVRVVAEARAPMDDPPELVLRLDGHALRVVEAVCPVIRFDTACEEIRRDRRWGGRGTDRFALRRTSCVDPIEIEDGGLRLVVGVASLARVERAHGGEIVVQKRGRDLCVLEVDGGLPHAIATVDGDPPIDAAWTALRDDAARDEIVAAFMRAVATLVDRIVDRVRAGATISDGERHVLLAAAAVPFGGRAAPLAEYRRRRAAAGDVAAAKWLRAEFPDASDRVLADRIVANLVAIETLALSTTAGTRRLAEILDANVVRWCTRDRAPTRDEVGASAPPELVLDDGERDLVARLVGHARLVAAAAPTQPVDPRVALVESVRAQLRSLRSSEIDDDLDVLELRPHESSPALAFADADRIVLNESHPVARRALRHLDPILVALSASAVYTALRPHAQEVDDVRTLAELLLT